MSLMNMSIDYDEHNGAQHFTIPEQLTYDCDLTIFTFLSDMLKEFIKYNDNVPQSYVELYEDHNEAFEAYQKDIKILSDEFALLREQSHEEGRYSDNFKLKVSMAFAKLQLLLPTLWW